ncbi:hypothetical protein BJX63DRAFT_77192 [Aspergillus granulosus]|uniref:Uncharacterized protein n=1 Tax=Aspergillus granulosus TaxID=176169 RepID=A0ABR4GW19_9EURO
MPPLPPAHVVQVGLFVAESRLLGQCECKRMRDGGLASRLPEFPLSPMKLPALPMAIAGEGALDYAPTPSMTSKCTNLVLGPIARTAASLASAAALDDAITCLADACALQRMRIPNLNYKPLPALALLCSFLLLLFASWRTHKNVLATVCPAPFDLSAGKSVCQT